VKLPLHFLCLPAMPFTEVLGRKGSGGIFPGFS